MPCRLPASFAGSPPECVVRYPLLSTAAVERTRVRLRIPTRRHRQPHVEPSRPAYDRAMQSLDEPRRSMALRCGVATARWPYTTAGAPPLADGERERHVVIECQAQREGSESSVEVSSAVSRGLLRVGGDMSWMTSALTADGWPESRKTTPAGAAWRITSRASRTSSAPSTSRRWGVSERNGDRRAAKSLVAPLKGRMLRHRFPEHCRTPPGNPPRPRATALT